MTNILRFFDHEKKHGYFIVEMLKTTVVSKYAIIYSIGKGAFGEVYKAVHLPTGKMIAMKVESKDVEPTRLIPEYLIYKKIFKNKNIHGISKTYELIQTNDYNILIMELLGQNLEDIFEKNNCHFSVSTVLHMGIEIIKIMRTLHNAGFVHRDIKPNNFLIGNKFMHRIYITDMGLSKEYIKSDGKHIKETFGHSIIGTARYSSINMHLGIEPSRRDDLESIGYMLIYFVNGKLPWQGLVKRKNKDELFEKIGDLKLSINLNILCKDLPSCFSTYIDYCRNLHFEQTPDYEYLINLFKSTIKKYNFVKQYEWMS